MNWKRGATGVILAVPILALLLFGLGQDPRAIQSPLPGGDAPGFRLAVLDGTPTDRAMLVTTADGSPGDTISLEAHRGEVVVLNFFASWCVACRVEHGVLDRGARRYADRGVRFYGVLYQDSPENALRWIRAMGGQVYPSLLDPSSRTAIDFGLYGVPESYFIGPEGTLVYKHVGPLTDEVLTRKLDEILAGSAS